MLQAQNLAELAIDAREKAEKGRQKAAEAERDVEAAVIVRQKLEADIEQLRQISSEPAAAQGTQSSGHFWPPVRVSQSCKTNCTEMCQ